MKKPIRTQPVDMQMAKLQLQLVLTQELTAMVRAYTDALFGEQQQDKDRN